MTHPFMAAVAGGLGERQIATSRFIFRYKEQGSKRPARPAFAQPRCGPALRRQPG